MSTVLQFISYNLLPALLAGILSWALVHGAVRVFAIRHGRLRLCLYLAPVLKSTLVLLGLATVAVWPGELFGRWHAASVPFRSLWPAAALLTVAYLIASHVLADRERRRLLADATPAPAGERLELALDRVLEAYGDNAARIAARCPVESLPGRPRLLVRDSGLRSPAVVLGAAPALVFPAPLVERLDDKELDGAVAHELAHVYLRQPGSCTSPETVSTVAALNPFAGLMAAQLRREEEKACDDVAIDVLGEPERYAGMLTSSYRHAIAESDGFGTVLRYVPQLLGIQPLLTERVEHVLAREPAGDLGRQRVGFVLTWALLVAVFFIS